jgi:hypothetical protein
MLELSAKVLDLGLNVSIDHGEYFHIEEWWCPARHLPVAVVLTGKSPEKPFTPVFSPADHNSEHLASGLTKKGGCSQLRILLSSCGQDVYPFFLFHELHEFPAMAAGTPFMKEVFSAAIQAEASSDSFLLALFFLLHEFLDLD